MIHLGIAYCHDGWSDLVVARSWNMLDVTMDALSLVAIVENLGNNGKCTMWRHSVLFGTYHNEMLELYR